MNGRGYDIGGVSAIDRLTARAQNGRSPGRVTGADRGDRRLQLACRGECWARIARSGR